ncbi:MAG: MOP flippase family protein [Candidatus Omnitrophica bacterium]|nr:MOP flippase family protein [Candidatus Omnitrophota bacterium]
MTDGLKTTALRSLRATSAAGALGMLLQAGTIAVIARFLTPYELGLFGIAGIVSEFSQWFLDLGLSNSIIHYQKISRETLSTLYWLNVIFGAGIFALICLAAPALAGFYGSAELSPLITVLALTFLIIPLGSQFNTLLQKELRFRTVSFITVTGQAVGFMATLIFLRAGLKVYSAAWGTVAGCLCSSLLFLICGRSIYAPLPALRFKGIRKFLSFGLFQVSERAFGYFTLQVDSLLIGKVLGLPALGFYTLAKKLVLKPLFLVNPVVTSVSFPLMAKMQDDLAALRRSYLAMLNHLSSAAFFFYACIAAFASPLVTVLFTDKWSPSIGIIQILALWAALRSTGIPVTSLILARGRVDYGLYWALAVFCFTPAIILAGSVWGITGICLLLLAMQVTLFIPGWFFLVRPLCGASLKQHAGQLIRPAVAAGLSALCGFFPTRSISPPLIRIAAGGMISSLFFLLISSRLNKRFLQSLAFFVFPGTGKAHDR